MKKLLRSVSLAALSLFTLGVSAQSAPVGSVSEITDGWYQFEYLGNRTPEAVGRYVVAYTEEFAFMTNNKYYPLGLDSLKEGQEARSFVYVKKNGDYFRFRTLNGHWLQNNGMATLDQGSCDDELYDAEGIGINVKHLMPFGEGANNGRANEEFGFFWGRSSNSDNYFNIYQAPVDEYDMYEIVLELPMGETATMPYDQHRVAYVGSEQLSSVLPKVYNGGYFIFPKGTKVSPEDFVGDAIENYDSEAFFDGNTIYVSYVPNVDFAEITYVYHYNGEVVGEETLMGVIGQPYPEPSYNFPWGAHATAPEGIVEDVESFDLDVTVSGLPFEFKTSISTFADVEHWYYLRLKNATYARYIEGEQYIALQGSVDKTAIPEFKWAFVGDPFKGFKLYNEAAGIELVANNAPTANDGNTGGNTFVFMASLSDLEYASDNVWQYSVASSDWTENGFYMFFNQIDDHKDTYMNNRGNKLAYWTGGHDLGSTFNVEEVFSAAKTLQDAIDAAQATYDKYAPNAGQLGFPTADAMQSIQENIDFAKTVLTDGEATDEDIYNNVSSLTEEVNAALEQVVYPEDGKYYAFVNHQLDGSIITMYMTEEGLAAEMGKTPEEIGDAAYFKAIADTTETWYKFYSEPFDGYLVWKGHQGGYNDNKGFVASADAEGAEQFTTLKLTTTLTYLDGSFVFFGYRGNGAQGTFIFTPEGAFNAWGYSVGYAAGYSNLFTVVEKAGDDDHVNQMILTPADAIIYDLQGRKVTAPTQGLYIQNGKKIMVK